MNRAIAAAVALAACPALAQGQSGGPGPCGGFFTRNWVGQPFGGGDIVINPGDVPVSEAHEASGVAGLAVSDEKALLVLVVFAVAALPVFVYALDREAGPDLMQCWSSPSERFNFYGGGVGGEGGYLGVQGTAAFGFIGVDLSAENGLSGYRDLRGTLAIRAPPRQHVDLGIAFGVHEVVAYEPALAGYSAHDYFEIAVPHRYLPFRTDAYNPGLGLELRPAVLISRGAFDVRLDASLVVPFGPWASLLVGGRIYSLESELRTGFTVGFDFSL